MEDRGETVVRKGSFKVLKPKLSSSSESKLKGSDSKELQQEERANREEGRISMEFKIEPLKEIYVVDDNRGEQEELNSRKTIPKMHEKPPLYRSKQK